MKKIKKKIITRMKKWTVDETKLLDDEFEKHLKEYFVDKNRMKCLPCHVGTPSLYFGYDSTTAIKPCERIAEYVEIAVSEAKKSSMTQKHGCVIVHRNRVVAAGHNKAVEPYPLKSIHAEAVALTRAKRILTKSELKQSKLIVVRIGTDSMKNPLKYSKPCAACESFISKQGISMVYYSTSDR